MFLANQEGAAHLDKVLAERDQKTSALEAELAELRAFVAAQQALAQDAAPRSQPRGGR